MYRLVCTLLLLFSCMLFPQETRTLVLDEFDLCRVIKHSPSGGMEFMGILHQNDDPTEYLMQIGVNNYTSSSKDIERAIFQWSVPDDLIPDGSTISEVILTYKYTANLHGNQLYANFSTIKTELKSDNCVKIWEEAEDLDNLIGANKESNINRLL